MHSLHPVNASHGCQATRTHSTAWLTSKPTGNSWRPHGPVEVGWCLGWSTRPWVLEISSKFFQWYESPHLSSHSSHSFPQVPLSYKNSEIFGLHRLWWVEQGSEVSCVATGRPNWKSGGWLLGKRNKLPCRLGWGVLLVLKQIQYYPLILGILGSKESVGKREGKNKTLTPASASPFRYSPIYSLAIPCMLHSLTFGTV